MNFGWGLLGGKFGESSSVNESGYDSVSLTRKVKDYYLRERKFRLL